MADDLVFEVGLSPREVSAMTIDDLAFWHERAIKYYGARNEAISRNTSTR